jgi:cytoskeletal protein RodZ
MEDQKEILNELETELQQMNAKETPVEKFTEENVEDHHSKKHIGVIILLTVLLVAILVIIALVFRPSQEPEDVLKRLESVSEPVTRTVEETAQELENLGKARTTVPITSLPEKEQEKALQDAQSKLDQLDSL